MNKKEIELYIKEGLSTYDISKETGKSQTTVRYWLKKYSLKTEWIRTYSRGNDNLNPQYKDKYDVIEIQKDIDNGMRYTNLVKKYGISNSTLAKYSKEGKIKFKSKSEIALEVYSNGKCPLSKMTYEQRRKNGLKCGGYKERSGRSKGGYRIDSNGKETYLQSSYEIKCADILNDLNIKWIRPKPLKYKSDKIRNYFPDFFLIDYNIYLDPKNSYLIKIDKLKIKLVQEQNSVIVIILRNEDLSNENIKNIITHYS